MAAEVVRSSGLLSLYPEDIINEHLCQYILMNLVFFKCSNMVPYFFKDVHSTHCFKLRTRWLRHIHNDVIKWKHFPRYWPFVRGIQRSPVNSPHKGQWRGALMFTLICTRINDWVNNGEGGDMRRYRAHYDVTVMITTLENFIDLLWPGNACMRQWTGSSLVRVMAVARLTEPSPGLMLTYCQIKQIFEENS